MNTYANKPQGNKSQAVANTVTPIQQQNGKSSPLLDNRLETAHSQALQKIADDSARVKQFSANQQMANHYTALLQEKGTTTGTLPVIQRMIGDGGIIHHGRVVTGPLQRKYEIIGHDVFNKKLTYKLLDRGGNEIIVDSTDRRYQFEPYYSGVMGLDKLDKINNEEYEEDDEYGENMLPEDIISFLPEPLAKEYEDKLAREAQKKKIHSNIEFTVSRREGSARTFTKFANPAMAIRVLTEECSLNEKLATSLINKRDWSYPTMRSLMEELEKSNSLQPGLQEGANLWKSKQPSTNYTITTSQNGSQLAQIVGCHLMEYQETNNGTQGPRQTLDESRKKQLRFSEAILSLPSTHAPQHSMGVGLSDHVKLFPAMFDVKFEDTKLKLFNKKAGSVTFKLYQTAIRNRDLQFDHEHTLLDDARKDRKEKTIEALRKKHFEADDMDKFKNEDFIHTHLGLKDTESDNSMDEDEDWKFPYTPEEVGKWTMKELHEYVFKHNVYAGVLFKEYAAKLAELDALEGGPQNKTEQLKVEKLSASRKRVQNRMKNASQELLNIMIHLKINIVDLYRRLKQWKEKWEILNNSHTTNKDNQKTIESYKATLEEYAKKTLSELKSKGYPTPLDGLGDVYLKLLTEAPEAEEKKETSTSTLKRKRTTKSRTKKGLSASSPTYTNDNKKRKKRKMINNNLGEILFA